MSRITRATSKTLTRETSGRGIIPLICEAVYVQKARGSYAGFASQDAAAH